MCDQGHHLPVPAGFPSRAGPGSDGGAARLLCVPLRVRRLVEPEHYDFFVAAAAAPPRDGPEAVAPALGLGLDVALGALDAEIAKAFARRYQYWAKASSSRHAPRLRLPNSLGPPGLSMLSSSFFPFEST